MQSVRLAPFILGIVCDIPGQNQTAKSEDHLEQGIVVKRRLGFAADLVHDLHRLDWEAACCRLATAATLKTCSGVA